MCLTNRSHVAVLLFRRRQNVVRTKKVAHEARAECVTDVLTTFWRLLWSITQQTHGKHGICLFYIITKQTTTEKAFFYFKIFQYNPKASLRPLWRTRKKSLAAMRSKELWLVQENHATVKLDSSKTRAPLLVGWKLTAKASLRSKRFRGVQEQRITPRKKRGEGERKEGRKRLPTNPWILKTAYLAFHAWVISCCHRLS